MVSSKTMQLGFGSCRWNVAYPRVRQAMGGITSFPSESHEGQNASIAILAQASYECLFILNVCSCTAACDISSCCSSW